MKYKNLNGLRTVQVMTKEAALYAGSIDGKMGPGTLKGLQQMLDFHHRSTTGRPMPAPTYTAIAGDEVDQAIGRVQDLLKAAGTYPGKVDGIYGNGTYNGVYVPYMSFITQNNVPAYDAAWSKRVTKAFIAKIRAWVKMRGHPPEAVHWLMACMCFESAGTFRPDIQNAAGSQAYGLIQFMAGAAKDLGTTLDQIKRMSQMDQLDLVFAYFDLWAKWGKEYNQLEDFYLTIFYPKAVGMSADQVLFDRSNSAHLKAYTQNKGFDFDRDGKITVGEISSRLYDTFYSGMDTANRVIL
jgi:hypothetical protein